MYVYLYKYFSSLVFTSFNNVLYTVFIPHLEGRGGEKKKSSKACVVKAKNLFTYEYKNNFLKRGGEEFSQKIYRPSIMVSGKKVQANGIG